MAWLLAILTFLLVIWLGGEALWIQAVRPKTQSLGEFLRDGPKVREICRITYQGKPYLKVSGAIVVYPLTFPSGPAVYIFDERGLLVDWTADAGEAGPGFAKWFSLPRSEQKVITTAEALQWAHER